MAIVGIATEMLDDGLSEYDRPGSGTVVLELRDGWLPGRPPPFPGPPEMSRVGWPPGRPPP